MNPKEFQVLAVELDLASELCNFNWGRVRFGNTPDFELDRVQQSEKMNANRVHRYEFETRSNSKFSILNSSRVPNSQLGTEVEIELPYLKPDGILKICSELEIEFRALK